MAHLLTDIERPMRTITLAFLACGCRTVYDTSDRQEGDVVVCPNLYSCNGHDNGWTSVTQTLPGSLQGTLHSGTA